MLKKGPDTHGSVQIAKQGSTENEPLPAEMMGRIKEAVLQQISARLPIEMQVLNAVLKCTSRYVTARGHP